MQNSSTGETVNCTYDPPLDPLGLGGGAMNDDPDPNVPCVDGGQVVSLLV